MGNVFDVDSKFYRVIGKIIDLVKLNFLWILCSLPIITIGASTSALLYVTGKMAAGEDGYAARSYLKQVKQNLRSSLKYWIPSLVVLIVLWFDYLFWKGMLQTQNTIALAMLTFIMIMTCVFGMVLVYVFRLSNTGEYKGARLWKTAILLTFKYLPKSFMMLLWTILAVFAARVWAIGLLVMVLVGASCVTYFQSYILNGICVNQTTF